MRFDTQVVFEKRTPGRLDPATGNREAGSVQTQTRFASVTCAMEQTKGILEGAAGDLREGALVIRIQGKVDAEFDQIVVDGKPYRLIQRRGLRRMEIFVVQEDNNQESRKKPAFSLNVVRVIFTNNNGWYWRKSMSNLSKSVKLSKWGNGTGILIPALFAKELEITPGDQVKVEINNRSLIITPVKKMKSLADRFAEYSGPIELTEEWDFEPVGNEYSESLYTPEILKISSDFEALQSTE